MSIKIEPTKLHILKRRMEIIWQLVWEGYSDIDIGDMVGLERTWVYRLRKRMPKNWKPTLEKIHLPNRK